MERERALRIRMENEVDNFRSEKKKIEADIEMSLAIKQRFRKELEQTIDRLHFTIKKGRKDSVPPLQHAYHILEQAQYEENALVQTKIKALEIKKENLERGYKKQIEVRETELVELRKERNEA